MDSSDSTQTVFNTISNYKNSDVETPDEYLDSGPSRTNFSPPHFQPIASQLHDETSPSSYTDATPILSPLSSNQPDKPSPMTDNQLEHKLDIL